MPRIPRLTPRKVIQILKRHGFLIDHTTGSHFTLYHPKTKHRVTVAYHSKDIPLGTLASILKQADIDPRDL